MHLILLSSGEVKEGTPFTDGESRIRKQYITSEHTRMSDCWSKLNALDKEFEHLKNVNFLEDGVKYLYDWNGKGNLKAL